MDLVLFKEYHGRTEGVVYTPKFEVMQQAVVEAYLTGGADEIFDDQMYKLVESQEFRRGLVQHLIKSLTVAFPVTCFEKQQARKAVAIEAMLRQDMSREIPNVYTSLFGAMEQAAKKTFFTGGADDLLDDKMYKLFESQDFTLVIIRHLIKSSRGTVQGACLVKQQSEEAFVRKAKFRQDMSRENPSKID